MKRLSAVLYINQRRILKRWAYWAQEIMNKTLLVVKWKVLETKL
jgi:hypothetical protein